MTRLRWPPYHESTSQTDLPSHQRLKGGLVRLGFRGSHMLASPQFVDCSLCKAVQLLLTPGAQGSWHALLPGNRSILAFGHQSIQCRPEKFMFTPLESGQRPAKICVHFLTPALLQACSGLNITPVPSRIAGLNRPEIELQPFDLSTFRPSFFIDCTPAQAKKTTKHPQNLAPSTSNSFP